ncbi:Opine oxidase subunit A (Octopine oxidase subunit A) [Bosea sp. LC85]|uniref:FAD-dependent oxidoreductase n=1 Tax=Bosea sp. LC85 TaxID=1502851 RepID=UPI0004E2B757|nr:FAD-dependent oxidoreductase [Bosea sp. LC85]KFC71673.1 Opine oxidase subunit A (Octopine oxidase subunit A) [Bosea sp. LC85]
MTDAPILVVGGGPAGASAAATLAEAGLRVLLVEQRDQLGGAIHRQPALGAAHTVHAPARHRRNWAELARRIDAAGSRIELHTGTVFLGVDGDGRHLFDDRATGRVVARTIRAAVIAVGAVEKIHPFEGWDLPGVMTAGGAQVLLKETGVPPTGPTLVAGTGPLLLAVSAQLAKAGNPPVAVLERGRPWLRVNALLQMVGAGQQLAEAASYAATLLSHWVPYRTGTDILSVREDAAGLEVRVRRSGSVHSLRARHLLVHDGIEPNRVGIPIPDPEAAVPVVLAGDGREILGADAAILDGRRAACMILARLGLRLPDAQVEARLKAARNVQAAISNMFRSALPEPTPETLICRCEARRLSDFRSLPDDASAREIRLMGRFGMGVCQGRFCGSTIAALRGEAVPSVIPPRWPLRPVSLAALADLKTDELES